MVDTDGLTGDERRALSGEVSPQHRPAVRAAILRAWCLDGPVNLRGAVVVGPLDLSAVRLNSVLRLHECEFTDPVDLTGARVGEAVYLTGCALVGLAADRLSVAGDLVLDDSRSSGTVSLVDAHVGGSLSATGAVLDAAGGVALDGSGLTVDGPVRCERGFRSTGEVRLSWARLGAFHAGGALLRNPGGTALAAQGATVASGMFLDAGFRAEGSILLREATVAGPVKCTGASVDAGPAGTAIEAGLLDAVEVLLDEGFTATGEVNLEGSAITKRLTCNDATLAAPGGVALNLDGLDCSGKVFLGRTFTAQGVVRAVGARVRDELNCSGGRFDGTDGSALLADGLVCTGSVYLNEGFLAEGVVSLVAADIRTQLNATGGEFRGAGGVAVRADGLVCAGSVYLNGGFTAAGTVQLVGAEVRAQLNCSSGRIRAAGGTALRIEGLVCGGNVYLNDGFEADGSVSARGAKVSGTLVFRPGAVPSGEVDLSYARVGMLDDDLAGWPPGRTTLAGLTFGSLAEPGRADDRCRWLRGSGYAPDVYQGLSRVYRQAGQEDDARAMAIERQRDRRRRGNVPGLARAWSWFLDHTVRYGYETQRVIVFVAVLWLVSIYPFHLAQLHHIMQPASSYTGPAPDADRCTAAYPCFVPAVYSLEILFPVINLHQVSYWLPSGASLLGQLLWVYVWCAILLGWMLSIAVAGGIGHLFSQKD